jgi:hypothetical protein
MLSPICNTCPYYLKPCYLPHAIHLHIISGPYLPHAIHVHIILGHVIFHTQYTSKLSQAVISHTQHTSTPSKRVIFHSCQNYFYCSYFSKHFIYYLQYHNNKDNKSSTITRLLALTTPITLWQNFSRGLFNRTLT